MDLQNEKCVMVIDEQLPLGLIANTAAIMGITLGKEMQGISRKYRERLYEPEYECVSTLAFAILYCVL